jgi:hypothetical protein
MPVWPGSRNQLLRGCCVQEARWPADASVWRRVAPRCAASVRGGLTQQCGGSSLAEALDRLQPPLAGRQRVGWLPHVRRRSARVSRLLRGPRAPPRHHLGTSTPSTGCKPGAARPGVETSATGLRGPPEGFSLWPQTSGLLLHDAAATTLGVQLSLHHGKQLNFMCMHAAASKHMAQNDGRQQQCSHPGS